jgi:hypothetical protein
MQRFLAKEKSRKSQEFSGNIDTSFAGMLQASDLSDYWLVGENRPCGLPHQPGMNRRQNWDSGDFLFVGEPTRRHICVP